MRALSTVLALGVALFALTALQPLPAVAAMDGRDDVRDDSSSAAARVSRVPTRLQHVHQPDTAAASFGAALGRLFKATAGSAGAAPEASGVAAGAQAGAAAATRSGASASASSLYAAAYAAPLHPEAVALKSAAPRAVRAPMVVHSSASDAADGAVVVQQPWVLDSSNVRSYMQTADTPQSMNSAAARFVHGIDRKGLGNKAAPNYLDVDINGGLNDPVYPDDTNTPYATSDDRSNAVSERERLYAEGAVAIPAGVPLAMAVLTCFGWCIFCGVRCCCDACGGRRASEKYDQKQRNVCRILIVVNFLFMVIVFAFGMSANAGVSNSVDAMVNSADLAVGYMFSYHGLVNQGLVVLQDAYGRMNSLNETIYGVLPNGNVVANYTTCINSIYVTLNYQTVLLGQVLYLQNITKGMTNLRAFAQVTRDWDTAIKQLPHLQTVEQRMRNLNNSLALIPDANMYTPPISALNINFVRYKAEANASVPMTALSDTTRTLNTYEPYERVMTRNDNAMNTFQTLLTNLGSELGGSSTQGTTLSHVNTVISGMDTLRTTPNLAAYTTLLTQLNTALQTLNGTRVLIPLLTRLQVIIAEWGSLAPLNDTLYRQKMWYATGAPQLATLVPQVRAIDKSLRNFPDMSTYGGTISGVDAGTQRLRNANLSDTQAGMLKFNASLPGLACLLPLFATIRGINDTLVELPNSLNETLALEPGVRSQLANMTKTIHDVNKGYQALSDLNTTLYNMPDFKNLLNKTERVNQTLNLLPNMTSTLNALEALQQATTLLQTAPTVDDYITALNRLRDSFAIDNLALIVDRMQALAGNLSVIANPGPTIQDYVDSYTTLTATGNTLYPQLVDAQNYLTNTGYPYNQVATINPMITNFKTAVDNRPAAATFIQNMRGVNASIVILTSAPVNLRTASQQTRDLSLAVSTFPSLLVLTAKSAALDAGRTGQPGLVSIITTNSLSALNATLVELPDLIDAANSSDKAQTEIDTADFQSFIDSLRSIGTTFTDAARTDTVTQLQKLNDFRDGLPDIQGLLVQLNDSRLSGEDAQHSMVQYQNDYYYNRNYAVLYANEYDGQRVLFINILFFMPMFLALLGVIGCVLQKPCPIMWMALSSLGMMAVLFFFSAVVMIPSVVMTDTCEYRDTIASVNLAHTDVPQSSLEFGRDDAKPNQPGAFDTSASQNMTVADLYTYYTTCNNPRVQALVDQMQQPAVVLRRAGYNISDTLGGVKRSATDQGYTLRQGVVDQVDGFNVPYASAETVLQNFGSALQCNDNNALHLSINAFYEGMCDRLATSLAMCTCLLWIAGACSLPGVIIGVRAYKRLDPANFKHRTEQDKDADAAAEDGENKLDDGHGASGSSGASHMAAAKAGSSAADRDAAKVAAMMAARGGGASATAGAGAGTGSAHGHARNPSHGLAKAAPIGSSVSGPNQPAQPRYVPAAASGAGAGAAGVEMQPQGVRALQFDASGNLIS